MNKLQAKFGGPLYVAQRVESCADQLVLLAFPTQEFGAQELKTNKEVQAFAEQYGPPGLVVLETTPTLAQRPGWFHESVPDWNFVGKWLVHPDGHCTLVQDGTETGLISEIGTLL